MSTRLTGDSGFVKGVDVFDPPPPGTPPPTPPQAMTGPPVSTRLSVEELDAIKKRVGTYTHSGDDITALIASARESVRLREALRALVEAVAEPARYDNAVREAVDAARSLLPEESQ